MSLIQVIFSSDFLLALITYTALSIVCMYLMHRVDTQLQDSALLWPWEHVGMPLLKVLLMLVFILICYPAIFGLESAPAFKQVMLANGASIQQ